MYNEEEIFAFLNSLQSSGEDMTLAHSYLISKFSMTKREATIWIGDWLNTFSKPFCEDCE